MATTSSSRNTTEMAELIRDFNRKLRLARASELASHGLLLESERILCEIGVSQVSGAELDLLARIHVRQGRFEDARKRWEQALARDEGSRAKFEECLRELEVFSIHKMKIRVITWWVTIILLMASLALGTWTLIRLAIQN
jgi:hypothetical protein